LRNRASGLSVGARYGDTADQNEATLEPWSEHNLRSGAWSGFVLDGNSEQSELATRPTCSSGFHIEAWVNGQFFLGKPFLFIGLVCVRFGRYGLGVEKYGR